MRRSIFYAITVLFFVSCVSMRPGLKKYDLLLVNREDISKKLAESSAGLRSISGRFDFSYSTRTDRKQSSGYVFMTGNDTLYLEIKGLVGETEAVLFIDRDSLKAVNYFENLSIREKSSENSVRRIIGIDMDVTDLRNSLLGQAGSSDVIDVGKPEYKKVTARVSLDSTRYSIVTFDQNLSITEITEFEERDIRYKKQYDYFSEEKGVAFPRRIRISAYNPPSKLTIFFRDIKINTYPEIGL